MPYSFQSLSKKCFNRMARNFDWSLSSEPDRCRKTFGWIASITKKILYLNWTLIKRLFESTNMLVRTVSSCITLKIWISSTSGNSPQRNGAFDTPISPRDCVYFTLNPCRVHFICNLIWLDKYLTVALSYISYLNYNQKVRWSFRFRNTSSF